MSIVLTIPVSAAGILLLAKAASGYIGPGDLVPGATAWWGLRAYNSAYATGSNNAINIRRASDSTTTDIAILANGNLDVATATTFCASTTCFVTEAYDQTGNNHHITQGTAAAQPQLIFNCNGALPCIKFLATNANELNSGAITQAQPFTISYVGVRTSLFTTVGEIIRANGTPTYLRYEASANTVGQYAGTSATKTATDSVYHALNVLYTGASSEFNIDGADNATSVGTNALTSTVVGIGTDPPGGERLNGNIEEIGIWGSGYSTLTQRQAVHTNQSAYWGTP